MTEFTADEARDLTEPVEDPTHPNVFEWMRPSEKGNDWYAVHPKAGRVIPTLLRYAYSVRFVEDSEQYGDLARRFEHVFSGVSIYDETPKEMELSDLDLATIEQSFHAFDSDVIAPITQALERDDNRTETEP